MPDIQENIAECIFIEYVKCSCQYNLLMHNNIFIGVFICNNYPCELPFPQPVLSLPPLLNRKQGQRCTEDPLACCYEGKHEKQPITEQFLEMEV